MDRDLESVQQMRDMVSKAKQAQSMYMEYSQEQVDQIVKYVAEKAHLASGSLAKLAVEETGMGVAEHKKMKNELSSMGVYESIKSEKTVGIIREDRNKKITEIAYPFGVIACIIPTTNPTATAFFKTLISLKTRNAIVVSPHPTAVKCTIEALKVCNQAAVEAGAPEGLIGWIRKPTMAATSELMKHKDVDLILATGGGGLVKAAYSSGKPAYGVGPGNVPVYIEKTANVKNAIKMIVDSKTFDNGTICATEQAIVVHKNIKEMAVRELKNNGSYFLNKAEKVKMEDVISPARNGLNPKIVGRPAEKIAAMAGLCVPPGTRLLIAEEDRIGKDIPFSIEKLAPIFPLYTANDEVEAKEFCINLLNIGGRGHSLSLHTTDEEVIRTYGLEMPVSRIMINTLASIGAAGATTGLMPSMTLGCGSYGGNITSDNITAHHLINIKRVAHGIKDVVVPQPSRHVQNEWHDNSNDNRVEEIVDKVLKEINIQSNTINSETVSDIVNSVIKNYQ
ncbi:aldehyde dehydrogenase family protein [Virgibacillus oceani]|uniref:Aldehyde dehydrogenase n=1 Tax=Virgibacillus oceani TaxID=1479511 RepID=A0A917HHK7_9BACI|nr:aldehyde dehydrogenase family protein [Virgibacillus oceani]GGG79970.1 aldehyde dehydrogenase [Virgibacillus oceani]